MPTPADAPLRKVTLNLYEEDVETLNSHYGRGWSINVRDLVNEHAGLIRKSAGHIEFKGAKRRLEDLTNG